MNMKGKWDVMMMLKNYDKYFVLLFKLIEMSFE